MKTEVMGMETISVRLVEPTAKVGALLARAEHGLEEGGELGLEVIARATENNSNGGAEPTQDSAANGGVGTGVLGEIGAMVHFLTHVEMAVTAPLGKIPWPHLPAVRMGDVGIGVPHAHAHPPNLIPPAPPIPLPHMLTLLEIPLLSGAVRTMVEGKPAGRCGDLGVLTWCGGYFPLCEVFLGSSNVWIESMRAARVGTDITKHCIFSSPRPTDPPMGPMVGMTLSSASRTRIGGVPFPSLTAFAFEQAFKALFEGLGSLGRVLRPLGKDVRHLADRPGRKLTSRNRIERLFPPKQPIRSRIYSTLRATQAAEFVNSVLASKKINILHNGDLEFAAKVVEDLKKIAASRTGAGLLDEIASSPHAVYIRSPKQLPAETSFNKGPFAHSYTKWLTGVDEFGVRGPGTDVNIVYDPTKLTPFNKITEHSPSDSHLVHEFGHALDMMNGLSYTEDLVKKYYPGQEWLIEDTALLYDNRYRAEMGYELRKGHDDLP